MVNATASTVKEYLAGLEPSLRSEIGKAVARVSVDDFLAQAEAAKKKRR